MKRIIIALLGVLLLSSASFAADSKEYTFAGELIESLNRCQFFLDARLDVNAKSAEVMSAVMNANNQLEQAKLPIQKYLRDNDADIKRIAIDTVVGIDNFIDGNLKFLELTRKKDSAGPQGLKDLEDTLEKIAKQRFDAWRLIIDSAVTLPTVIAERAKSDYPTGPIPFKISKDERRLLRNQVNQLFKDKLRRFDDAREQKRQGKEFNPEDLSEFTFTVALIYDELSAETYEEFRLKVYEYKYSF